MPGRTLPFLALLVLAACATPREQCEADAAAPYRTALREQAQIAQDLARGYTFRTRFERVERWVTCRVGDSGFYPCVRTDMQPVTRKIPVDDTALRARQAELDRALPRLRRAAQTETAQCRALYPADG